MMKIIYASFLVCFVAFVASKQCKPNPRNLCPRINEVWDPCPQPCPPQTCRSIIERYDCVEANANYTSNCKGQCRCTGGYYRNAINECQSTEDCIKCLGPNEYFACGGVCDNVCDTLKNENQTSCRTVNIVCTSQCYCTPDTARNDDGICVPFAECPVKCPGPNEYYEKCAPSCPAQTCESFNQEQSCPDDQGECSPACRCIDGYYRDGNGVCKPQQECN